MAEVEAGPGVRVRTPDDVEVRIVQDGPTRRGIRRAATSTAPATADLKSALSFAGFELASELQIAPTTPGTRALRRDRDAGTEIEVTVGPSEGALVLIEGAGGVYAWSYPQEESPQPSRRRGPATRTLVFPLASTPTAGTRARTPSSGRRGAVLDWIGDKLLEPVRAYVLKFPVKAIIDTSVDYLEGDTIEGLVALTGDDPGQWRPGGAPLPALSQDRPARILLMVHGTFSSTAGGFGQLAASKSGKALLSKVRDAYDAVLGFDHKTLAVDPKTNAKAFMDALETLKLPKGSTLDAVAHSRGGLVYRVLAEELLETRRPDIVLGKAVFVGCTNGGTHLAEPKNWAAMVDLYTNAIMAGARGVAALAGGPAISPFVSMGIKTVGRFVQMFSEVAITEKRVPGLAAMRPASTVIEELNGRDSGLERLATYFAVTSNFVAKLDPRNGVTKELAEFVVDRVTNRLFQVDNDLVVDTASMTSFGTRNKRLEAGKTFSFGDTDAVYHTIYFTADRIHEQLAKWLGVDAAWSATAVREFSRGGAIGGAAGDIGAGLQNRTRSTTRRFRLSPPRPKKDVSSAPKEPTTTPGVSCHFAAEMNPYPRLKTREALFVTASRERIEIAGHAAAATSVDPVSVNETRKITIEVIGRKNCKVVGRSVEEIDVPREQRPTSVRFELEGIEKGVADVLVEARQGAQVLVSFTLAPVFVDDGDKLRASQSGTVAASVPEEPAVLRIYEIVEGDRVTLRFDLTCYDPNISVSESLTLRAGFSRDAYVMFIFKEIEKAWLTAGRVYDQFLLRLKSNGIVMARDLLPDPVRDALWRHRDAIRAIQVISEEPFIPWELLYITDPRAGPEGKGFLGEWGLVRWLHNTRWPGRRLALNGDRVRYVVPDYLDPALALDGAVEERKMLATLFAGSRSVDADSINVAEFLQAEAQNCDVLHFACHGEAAQQAVMRADLLMTGTEVDGEFIVDALSAEVAKTHARFAADGPRPIVFINACQTGRAGPGISAGVAGFVDAFLRPLSERGAGALIGALWSVDDKLAATFAKSFYEALLGGKSLVESARAAREAAKDRKDLTWLAYTVYGDPFARTT